MATNTITEETAERVAAAILRSERSKAWVATTTGIPLSTFTRKINAHTDFTVGELARIAEALGVPASKLLPSVFARLAAA